MDINILPAIAETGEGCVSLEVSHDNVRVAVVLAPDDARRLAASLTQVSIHVEEHHS